MKVTRDGRAVKPRALSPGRFSYDVAPDGRFLMMEEPAGAAPQPINLIVNWMAAR
ncbi:MAG: hypothetical protein ACRD96_01035 [Bryobacteraceae bacterium]